MPPVRLCGQNDRDAFKTSAAQQAGRLPARQKLILGGRTFVADHPSPHAHKGQKQLAKNWQGRDRTRHGNVVPLPVRRVAPAVLRPGMHEAHVRKPQRLHNRG